MTTIDNKRKQRKRTIFLTHNQGVPGSCPGGPTQYSKGFQEIEALSYLTIPTHFRHNDVFNTLNVGSIVLF
jgi:hypothetical protein